MDSYSGFRVSDPLAGLPRPTGEPETVERAGHAYLGAGEELGRASHRLTGSVQGVVGGAWVGAAGLSCERTVTALAEVPATGGKQAHEAATALLACGNHWRAALDKYDHARRLANEAMAEEAEYLQRADAQADQHAAAGDPAAAEAIRAEAASYQSPLRSRAIQLAREAIAEHDRATLQSAGHLEAINAGIGLSLGAPSRMPPSEILAKYQVPADEMTIWSPAPPWLVNWVPFLPDVPEKKITETEAELLNDIGWAGQLDMKDIKDHAFAVADERFKPFDQNDNHNDAFRHAYWNALMVARFGPNFAKKYATAHEAEQGNQAVREAMDLYNNEVGRRIAKNHPDASREELADLVEQAVHDGETVVVDQNGELAYSDQVEVGETGEPPQTVRHVPGKPPPGDRWGESSDGYNRGDADEGSWTASGDNNYG